MKNCLLICLAVFMLLSCGGSKSTTTDRKDTGSYIAPGYERKKYKKILVIAFLQQTVFRKRVEKSLVDQLSARKFNVIASTDIFTDEMMKDTLLMRAKAIEDGIDAVIILTTLGSRSTAVDRVAFNGNVWGFFGFTFAVMDLESRSAQVLYMQMDFMVENKLGTQYRVAIPVKTSNGSDVALEQFSLAARNRLISDRIL